ncbi:putative FHA domain-containing protein [uncultured Gammaproteobacteria bacterium]
MDRTYQYEIVVDVAGKSEIEGIYSEEKSAIARAEALLRQAKYTAVRVHRISSSGSQITIFEKSAAAGGKIVHIGHIDQACLCRTVQDLFCYDSRRALLHMMRQHCDEQLLLPSEFLHGYLPLRQIEREQALFWPVIHRLAAVQARTTRGRADERETVLLALFKELQELAKGAEASLAGFATYLNEHGLTGLINHVNNTVAEAERPRVVNYALARRLEQAREWGDKVIELSALAEAALSAEAMTCLDEMLAEVIDGNAPIRSLLGYIPDLGSALLSLAALSQGVLDDRYCATPPLFLLNRVIAVHTLPRVRATLLDRIARSLDGVTPLTKLNRADEAASLNRLVPFLTELGGFRGGPALCSALTRRAKTVLADGQEDLPFEEAVLRVRDFLNEPASRIGYLLDLLSTDQGRRKATFLIGQVGEVFAKVQNIQEFLPDAQEPEALKTFLAGFPLRLQIGGIPADLASRLQRRLETMIKVGTSTPSAPPPAIARKATRPAMKSAISMELTLDFPINRGNSPAIDIPHLIINFEDRQYIFTARDEEFNFGRSSQCHLPVVFEGVSRTHATITWSPDGFVITDKSKNGTFVTFTNRPPVLLRRTETTLDGEGQIMLGFDDTSDEIVTAHVVHFRYLPGTLKPGDV